MSELLQIGEVARLCGVTPKTIRYYQQTGLLNESVRSEGGYRLYDAADIMRLQQIRRLQSFGLSLKQIKDILGDSTDSIGQEHNLRQVLELLLHETTLEISQLEKRRARIEKLLKQTDLNKPLETAPSMKKAQEQLGSLLDQLSPRMLEQENRIFDALDSYNWPEPYKEIQNKIIELMTKNPQLFHDMLSIEERLMALADAPADSLEGEKLAEDLFELTTIHPELLAFHTLKLDARSEASGIGEVFGQVLNATLSPAQQRFAEKIAKLSEAKQNEQTS